jgi:hypothetical protein
MRERSGGRPISSGNRSPDRRGAQHKLFTGVYRGKTDFSDVSAALLKDGWTDAGKGDYTKANMIVEVFSSDDANKAVLGDFDAPFVVVQALTT